MLEHINAILDATTGRKPEDIADDYLAQRALERAVEIISEAAKSLPHELRDREPDVPWKDIIGIGNLLRHEYYRIRADTMLNILRFHLPRLRPAIIRLIEEVETNG